MLAIDLIRMDGATQPRAAMREETIAEYEESIREGDKLPPPVIFFDGESYWLADGYHRVHALGRSGLLEIEADVRQGTRRDAILYSVGANAAHGLPRTIADKRRAVETLMRDEEWSQLSNREIARRCGVTHGMANSVRDALSGYGIQIDPVRTVERNGTTYEQNVERSARKPSIPLAPVASEPADIAAGRLNGTIPADAVVEVTEHEPAAHPEPDATPAEMTDAEYLESLPARPSLSEAVRSRFDIEALLYRAVAPIRLAYGERCKPLTNRAKRDTKGHIGPWLNRHLRYLSARGPTQWTACKECAGTGRLDLIGPCNVCHGEGYIA